MILKFLHKTVGVGCFLAAALTCAAAPLPRASVPAQAGWVFHVDCDSIRPTVVGKYLMAEAATPEAQQKFSIFQTFFNFDPRTALHGLTLYSVSGRPEDGVLLVQADVDPQRLLFVAQLAKDDRTITHGQHTIHHWIDEKRPAVDGVSPRTYASVIGGNLVVFSQKEGAIVQALDVIDGTAPSLAASGDLPQFGAGGASHYIEAVVRKAELPQGDANAAFFSMAKVMRLQLGETDGQVTGELQLEATDATVASHMTAIGQGLIALGKLRTDDPAALKLANGVTLTQNGANVSVSLKLSADDVVAKMQTEARLRAPGH